MTSGAVHPARRGAPAHERDQPHRRLTPPEGLAVGLRSRIYDDAVGPPALSERSGTPVTAIDSTSALATVASLRRRWLRPLPL